MREGVCQINYLLTYFHYTLFALTRARSPVQLASSSNVVTVAFVSDHSVEGKGFSLSYSAQSTYTGHHYHAMWYLYPMSAMLCPMSVLFCLLLYLTKNVRNVTISSWCFLNCQVNALVTSYTYLPPNVLGCGGL